MSEELTSILEFDEDLSNVEAPKPLPAGTYDAVIESAETMTSNSGKPMIKVTFNISADQYPVDYTDGNPEGTKLTQYLLADNTNRSKFALKRFILAIGAPLSNKIDVTTFIGLPAKVEVGNRMWQDVEVANIVRVLA